MSHVPGTFKNRPPTPVRFDGGIVESSLRAQGALLVECYAIGECHAIVSREPFGGEYRWHISISHPRRYPTWDEIKTAAYGIETVAGVVLAQILAPGDGSEWVNLHDNCFHLYEIHDEVLRVSI